MIEYTYTKTITGVPFNAQQKIASKLGVNYNDIALAWDDITVTVICKTELTTTQKTILDGIFQEVNICSIPANASGATYRIANIWGMRQWFNNQIGVTPIIWTDSQTLDGSGTCYMYLHFPRALTTAEKNKILIAYKNSISEVT